MKLFHKILFNTLIATTSNSFLWFAMTFWIYIETRSVIAAAVVGALYPLFGAVFGIFFGTYVDHHKKKQSMVLSSSLTMGTFVIAGLIYLIVPTQELLALNAPYLWIFIFFVMAGAVTGNLQMIALSTLVTTLIAEEERDKANGMVGMITGVGYAITSVFSGLAIGFLGMGWSIMIGILLSAAALVHLSFLQWKEEDLSHDQTHKKSLFDLSGALAATLAVPGLIGLIAFSMINNALGGVFMALMDPYGLELVSVELWGIIWGVLSVAFIIGGIIVVKKGLGSNPLRLIFLINGLIWIVTLLFPLKESIVFMVCGMFFYLALLPFVEAAEQTVLQKVVPFEKQGRVFGLAQTSENLVMPIIALAMGPLAHYWAIPLMSEGGQGAALIGDWFGTGINRGIAVIFILTSVLGLLATIAAYTSTPYKKLLTHYNKVKE